MTLAGTYAHTLCRLIEVRDLISLSHDPPLGACCCVPYDTLPKSVPLDEAIYNVFLAV
jgi:hypothetical protein